MQLNSYLIFNGQCEAAFHFYQQTLGGKIEAMIPHRRHTGRKPRRRGVGPVEIMHARLTVGASTLMGSDAPPERYRTRPRAAGSISASTIRRRPSASFRLWPKTGSIYMPLEKTFRATRFGMLVDRFGIPWMLNCE